MGSSGGTDVTESQYFTLILGGANSEQNIEKGIFSCKIRDLLGMNCHELALVNAQFPSTFNWTRYLPNAKIEIKYKDGLSEKIIIPGIEFYILKTLVDHIEEQLPARTKNAADPTKNFVKFHLGTKDFQPQITINQSEIKEVILDEKLAYILGLEKVNRFEENKAYAGLKKQKPVLFLGCDAIEYSTVNTGNYFQMMAAIQMESDAFTYQPRHLIYNKILKYNTDEIRFFFNFSDGTFMNLYKAGEIAMTFHVKRTCPFV